MAMETLEFTERLADSIQVVQGSLLGSVACLRVPPLQSLLLILAQGGGVLLFLVGFTDEARSMTS